MPYTLWSRGRLLGSTELGYRYKPHGSRMGDFFPTALGEKLMPIVTGLSPAGVELGKVSRAMGRSDSSAGTASGEAPLDRLRRTTEYADYAAAEAHSEALDLELRGPDGSVVATEWIGIQDTEFLLSLADGPFDDDWPSDGTEAFDPEREAALEKLIEADSALLDEMHEGFADQHDWADAAETELPRYQIHVRLIDNRSVP